MNRTALKLCASLAVVAVGACATPRPGSISEAQSDRYEKVNRKVYAFNRGLDRVALLPVTRVYRKVLPKPARQAVSNGFGNLGEPLSFINAVLQGKIKQAFRVVDRFLINSTIGFAGLTDQATGLGRPEESEDFGQTLAVWGINSGPYLMLPLIGPSTLRDAVGFAADSFADPIPYARNAVLDPSFVEKAAQFAGQTIDLRSRLIDAGADKILESSLDEYATVRSAFLQRRQSEIYDGNPPEADEDAPVEDAPLAPGATPPGPQTPGATPSPALPPQAPAPDMAAPAAPAAAPPPGDAPPAPAPPQP